MHKNIIHAYIMQKIGKQMYLFLELISVLDSKAGALSNDIL